MYPKTKKRQCIDRLAMLCKDHHSYVFKSYESLRDRRREFDYQVSKLIEEFYIEYEDIYDNFDEVWRIEVSSNIKEKDIEDYIRMAVNPIGEYVNTTLDYGSLYNRYIKEVEELMKKYIEDYEDSDENEEEHPQ